MFSGLSFSRYYTGRRLDVNRVVTPPLSSGDLHLHCERSGLWCLEVVCLAGVVAYSKGYQLFDPEAFYVSYRTIVFYPFEAAAG